MNLFVSLNELLIYWLAGTLLFFYSVPCNFERTSIMLCTVFLAFFSPEPILICESTDLADERSLTVILHPNHRQFQLKLLNELDRASRALLEFDTFVYGFIH